MIEWLVMLNPDTFFDQIMGQDWDSRYRDANTPWDKAQPHPYLASLRPRRDRKIRILVPGCGRGHDLRALAKIYPDAELIGMDISSTALEQAELFGVPKNATLIKADLFYLGDEWNETVDLVWEHTCFCAILPEERIAYREVMRRVMKRGAVLMGAFFLTMKENVDGGPPFNCSPEELSRVFADGSGFLIRRMGLMENTFRGREGEEWVVMASRERA